MAINRGRDVAKTYIGAYKSQLDMICLKNMNFGINKKYIQIEVTILCRYCGKPILPYDNIIHRGHGRVYHAKCWEKMRHE